MVLEVLMVVVDMQVVEVTKEGRIGGGNKAMLG